MEELIKTDDDINEILQTLKKIKVNINISPNASNSDKGLYNLLIEGTAKMILKRFMVLCRVWKWAVDLIQVK